MKFKKFLEKNGIKNVFKTQHKKVEVELNELDICLGLSTNTSDDNTSPSVPNNTSDDNRSDDNLGLNNTSDHSEISPSDGLPDSEISPLLNSQFSEKDQEDDRNRFQRLRLG